MGRLGKISSIHICIPKNFKEITLEAPQSQFLGRSLLGLIFQDKYNKRKKKATELHFSIFIFFQSDDKGLE